MFILNLKKMKKINLFFILLIWISIPLLQSCDDDDGYSLGDYLITMATVERDNSEGRPYFVWDNNERIWISNTLVPFGGLNTGERVIASFTLLSDSIDGFSHYARLNDYRRVLTKGVIELTEANADSIGDSKVHIYDMWIGSDYLNVQFRMFAPSTRKHMVNLVRNTTENYPDDGYIYLEYRYNDMGDVSGYFVPGIVSFKLDDIDKYIPGGRRAKGIKVRINSAVNDIRTLTFDYEDTTEDIRSFLDNVNSEQVN